MIFEVTVLGSNSAYPVNGRHPSAQVLNYNHNLYLIDCGEGTQIRMADFGIKRSRIDHVFISHLHGDHVFGLPGLINSYSHLSRNGPLHVYGPAGIRQMIDTTLRLSWSMIDFDVIYHEISASERIKILDNANLKIYAFPLQHRVPTYGYLFIEKNVVRNIRKDTIQEYGLTVDQIKKVKAGQNIVLENGTSLDSEQALLPQRTPRAFAYCSDTAFDESIVPWISGVDLLYHEATFLHALEQKANLSKHSTAFQAGMMARLADVGQLLVGHFSSRYKDLDPFLAEAGEAFPDVLVAEEGKTYQVG